MEDLQQFFCREEVKGTLQKGVVACKKVNKPKHQLDYENIRDAENSIDKFYLKMTHWKNLHVQFAAGDRKKKMKGINHLAPKAIINHVIHTIKTVDTHYL